MAIETRSVARPLRRALAGVLAALALAVAPGVWAPGAGAAEEGTAEKVIAVVNARLFDGEKVVPRATVVFSTAGKVLAVGPEVQPPAGAEVIDGSGRTLLPGLIDAHTHSFLGALERALVFGVTTNLDMMTDPTWAAARRREQAEGKATGRADLFSASTLVTAPGGHGTQFGVVIPTLARPEDAEAFVAARIAEGADYVKIVSEDGSQFGGRLGALDRPTIAAAIVAAQKQGKLAVVHVSTFGRAQEAIADGANGLVHLFLDKPADLAMARLTGERHAFVIPTLVVLEGMTGKAGGASLTTDPRTQPYLTVAEVQNLKQMFPRHGETRLDPALETVRLMKAAGVPILAGSDAPNPGTAHGSALHRELELLVQAGLTPAEALAAATSVPAREFGLADRGRVAPGLVADLLLVEGDPTQDVTATRAIRNVWKRGHAVDRPLQDAAPAEAPKLAAGLVSDFDGDEVSATTGVGWVTSTDQFRGGTSTAAIELTAGGAAGSKGSLAVSGEIRAGFAFPWAGAMYFPGAAAMAPVDASGLRELVFWARGEGGTFRVMALSGSAAVPSMQTFEVGPEWREVVLQLSSFSGMDPRALLGLLFSASSSPGPFRFQIDDIRLR